MKKILSCFCVLLLTISVSGCGPDGSAENIHSKIHSSFYDMKSYTAECSITAFTTGGENTYNCTVDYNKSDDSYKITTDDMAISLSGGTATVTKGDSSMKAPASDEDMNIFVNTFFKSYYESENTSMNVAAEESGKSTLLECDVVNSSDSASHMKLWISNSTVLPEKMQISDKDGVMNTEILFNKFEFKK